MTKEELALKLTGREYGHEITHAEVAEAKKSGLVVIFGYSDDNCELRGAINDEVGACQGATVLIGQRGTLLLEIERGDAEILEKYGVLNTALTTRKQATKIEALWCKEPDYSWTYKTEAPHATFEIMEDGEPWCRGIVIDLKELKVPDAD